jgi:hypothetical protein
MFELVAAYAAARHVISDPIVTPSPTNTVSKRDYSGHALQFGGVNYLAPIDTKLMDEADLHRLVRLDEIVNDL